MDPAPSSPASATSSSPSSSKLRLLCSYGGRIVPRPHDKALCYAGGESRLLAFDRRSATASLASLTSHISRSLLNGRPFTLKYQLPDHDLDSLVSVATDEDLLNMIDEYDRATISSNPTRLRFFLFPPVSSAKAAEPAAASPEYDPKSEAWFFDALRSAGISVNEKRPSSESGGDGMAESDGKSGDSSAGPAPMNSEWAGSARSAPASLPAIKVCGGGEEMGGLGQDLKAAYSTVDSPESDSSAMSPNFQSPTLVYLDSLSAHSDPIDSKLFTTPSPNPMDPTDLGPPEHLSSLQTYAYSFSQPMEQLHSQPQPTLQSYQQQQLQPQYIHAHPQYVPQYYSTTAPAAPYSAQYQPYLQHQQQPQQQAAYQMKQPYPVYLMHVGTQDLSTAQLLSKPQAPMNMSMMVGLGGPAKAPEIAAKVYRPGPTVTQPITVPSVQMGQTAATAMLLDNLTQLQLDTTK